MQSTMHTLKYVGPLGALQSLCRILLVTKHLLLVSPFAAGSWHGTGWSNRHGASVERMG